MIAPLTVGDILSAQARLRPNEIGARDLERTMTYRQWNERACRLANGLLGLGLKHGDRVAVLAYNCVEWAEIYTAVAKVGLVAVPINFRLTAGESKHIIDDSGARAVLVQHALVDVIEEARADIALPDGNYVTFGGATPAAGYLAYESLIENAADSEPVQVASADDAWCLLYTSGTTGKPKGAIRSHRGMAMVALMTEVELGVNRGDDALLVMPMCHANSVFFFTAFLYCGATVTIFSRKSFDPELCLNTFSKTGATFTSLVPTHYSLMLDVPAAERGKSDYGRVEKLMISSAPATVETKRAVMDMFPNSGLFELYGSTEAAWVTFLRPHEQLDHLGTVGREVVGSAPIKLLDDSGREVPDGQPGELFSCAPYCFDGYWNLPDATAEAFRGDYLSVGDIALRDEDGYIRLIDRKKNIIISGGENIYPSEVEAALASHPAVQDAAVVGVADPKWGELVTAAVVRRPGQELSESDLIAWARQRLAGYKRPRSVVFLGPDDMPRNATGKILHRELRSIVSEGRQVS